MQKYIVTLMKIPCKKNFFFCKKFLKREENLNIIISLDLITSWWEIGSKREKDTF